MALEQRSVPCWVFDHSMMKGAGLEAIAAELLEYIGRKRRETGISGPVDMVCHSMGTGIARYMLEVIDGRNCREEVGQLIGLGPPNNGSSLAELFFDPLYGQRAIRVLGGIFVPRRFDPGADVIVRQFRPGSEEMRALRSAGTRSDILYRLILTENRDAIPEFFPPFHGKTILASLDGWKQTYEGDGIVPRQDSWLPGAGYDILPRDPNTLLGQHPEHYCHLHLPRNREVIQKVAGYICDPSSCPEYTCPG